MLFLSLSIAEIPKPGKVPLRGAVAPERDQNQAYYTLLVFAATPVFAL